MIGILVGLYRLGFTNIISLENYGWYIEFTPALFGAGMSSGLNASWSFRVSPFCRIIKLLMFL